MLRGLAILVVVVLWATHALADAREDLSKGVELAKQGKFSDSKIYLDLALESGELDPGVQGLGHFMRALVHLELNLPGPARADFDRAVTLMEDPGSAYVLRSQLAWAQEDKKQSYEDMLTVATKYPQDVNEFDISGVWRVWRWLRDEKRPGDQFVLLEALAKAGFRGDDKHVLPDALMGQYVAGLIERGRLVDADRIVGGMVSTRVLIEMRTDGIYRKLWDRPAFKRKSEPRAAAEREQEFWAAAVKAEPRSLKAILNHMQILRALNRPAEAVALGKKVIAAPADYEDNAEDLLWLRNEVFYALLDTGQLAEANAMMDPLLQRSVEKEPSIVNQLINYGSQLMAQNRPEQALGAVAGAKPEFVSPFGQKWVDAVRVCAHAQMNKLTDANSLLERMKQTPNENYSAVMQALLCMNRIEEAAQLMIVRLRDPVHYDGALSALQTYAPPKHQLPFIKVLMGRLAEVRARADVRKEADKRGRLLTIPLVAVYWGDV